ncbi:MAG: hypothetical protein KY432_08895, partial [Acidobacteria bacterium]|nr:hypothetical protein [Acidobacteriota bacterium]
AVFLDDSDTPPRVKQRIALTRELIGDRATGTFVVQSRGHTAVERVFSLVLLGDLLSLYVAVLRGVDPTPVAVIDELKSRTGLRDLLSASSRDDWPQRGLYFFFENEEIRTDSGSGGRVVRVGTHAVSRGSKSMLWNRLSQHRGSMKSGGGNHRGSVFRQLLGSSLLQRRIDLACPSWASGSSAPRSVREAELELECAVSETIRAMPFVVLPADDEPGPQSVRVYLERNSIALLSNWDREVIDPPSPEWLGHLSTSEKVRRSGLWNSNHVEEIYDSKFLDELEVRVEAM